MLTGMFGRTVTSMSAGWDAFWDRWTASPTRQDTFTLPATTYQLRWALYNNTVFENSHTWVDLQVRAGLYKNVKPTVNPITRLVNTYVATTYRGSLSPDGKPFPDGSELAIPLPTDTPEALCIALGQLWQDSGFERLLRLIVLWTAALGDSLVEVVDDVKRGKVYFDIIWPAYVTDLKLDPQKNCQGYTVEYLIEGKDHSKHVYKKVVGKTKTSTFRDGQPYGYNGMDPVIDNPWGFVPAYWFMHRDVGGSHGAPAYDGSLNKVLRLMSLASHLEDYAHKRFDAPKLIATDGNLELPLFKQVARVADPTHSAPSRTPWDREQERLETRRAAQQASRSLSVIKAPVNTTVSDLVGSVSPSEVLELITAGITEIEKDHRMLGAFDLLRQMSNPSGRLALTLLGDVNAEAMAAQSMYDPGIISLQKMALTIAGERANQATKVKNPDGWRRQTAAQKKFLPFGIHAYERGEQDFTFPKRMITSVTDAEKAAEDAAAYATIQAGIDAGLPMEIVLDRQGWSQVQIEAVQVALDRAVLRASGLVSSEGAIGGGGGGAGGFGGAGGGGETGGATTAAASTGTQAAGSPTGGEAGTAGASDTTGAAVTEGSDTGA
jgi:hypothetical protein